MRSRSRPSAAIQRWVEPSWNSSVPGSGRRSRSAALGFRHQPGRLQRQLGHRVAELVIVPLHQLLVEVLHREVAVALPIELLHPLELARRRTARRYLADPPIAQPLDPILFVANAQPAEVPTGHAQQLPSLLARQPMLLVLLERFLKARHKNLP